MTGTLPSWAERLLDLGDRPGEGTLWTLEGFRGWPPWLVVLVVVGVVGLVVAVYRREQAAGVRRWLLSGLRLFTLGLLLLMLGQVEVVFQRAGLPPLAVLLDNSQSMAHIDRRGGSEDAARAERVGRAGLENPSRFNLARTLLLEDDGGWWQRLAIDYDVQLYQLGPQGAQRQPASKPAWSPLKTARASAASSPLGNAIRDILQGSAGKPPAAVVLLSDGIVTDGISLAEAADLATRRGVPLFTVALGNDEPPAQVQVTDLAVDEVVFVNDPVLAEFTLAGRGVEGRHLEVRLRQEGKREPLARSVLTLGPDGQPQQGRLPFRATEPGRFRLYLEMSEPLWAAPGPPLMRTIEVRDEKIRVLLVGAEPSFEYRYLRNLLARESTVELRTVLQQADPEHVAQDALALRVFPLQSEELARYDVVILDDADPAALGGKAIAHLADYVTRPGKGGALVVIAGPRYLPHALRGSPLADLLPVDLSEMSPVPVSGEPAEPFAVERTPVGVVHPALVLADTAERNSKVWKNLAPWYWLAELPAVKPAARVLAQHPRRLGHEGHHLPLILMQYVGSGRVWMHASDDSWRWRWRTGDLYFGRYWLQTIRWLARAKLAEATGGATLSTDRREYRHGEEVRLRLRFADPRQAPAEDDGAAAVVRAQEGPVQAVRLWRTAINQESFEAVLPGLAPGRYHVSLTTPSLGATAPAIDFAVLSPPREISDLAARLRRLQDTARKTGGKSYFFENACQLPDDLPPGRQVLIETLPPRPLWNRWPVLALLTTVLAAEWFLRKRSNLV